TGSSGTSSMAGTSCRAALGSDNRSHTAMARPAMCQGGNPYGGWLLDTDTKGFDADGLVGAVPALEVWIQHQPKTRSAWNPEQAMLQGRPILQHIPPDRVARGRE